MTPVTRIETILLPAEQMPANSVCHWQDAASPGQLPVGTSPCPASCRLAAPQPTTRGARCKIAGHGAKTRGARCDSSRRTVQDRRARRESWHGAPPVAGRDVTLPRQLPVGGASTDHSRGEVQDRGARCDNSRGEVRDRGARCENSRGAVRQLAADGTRSPGGARVGTVPASCRSGRHLAPPVAGWRRLNRPLAGRGARSRARCGRRACMGGADRRTDRRTGRSVRAASGGRIA